MKEEKSKDALPYTCTPAYDRSSCGNCVCATCYEQEFCDRCSSCKELSQKRRLWTLRRRVLLLIAQQEMLT